MIYMWTNYVSLQKFPKQKFKNNVTLFVGCGGAGGWEFSKALPVMREYEKYVKIIPSVACLIDYQGDTFESWFDKARWQQITDNIKKVFGEYNKLAIDTEPYFSPAKYPKRTNVADTHDEEYRMVVATQPLIDFLNRVRRRIFVAPGGLEYGLSAILLQKLERMATWLDEYTFASPQYANRRVYAEVLGNHYLPGSKTADAPWKDYWIHGLTEVPAGWLA